MTPLSHGGMPLTLQDLKSHLWNCAEILRGSAVDRTDWKAYILPLLFFKRICDVWDEETAEAVQLYGDVDPVDFPIEQLKALIKDRREALMSETTP